QLPSSAEEGWTRHQEKCCEATFDGAARSVSPIGRNIKNGVVLVHKCICFINTTPSARAKVASRLFLNRAATPPHLRRGVPFGCFATFIEKSAHPEFLEVRKSEISRQLRQQRSRNSRHWRPIICRPATR